MNEKITKKDFPILIVEDDRTTSLLLTKMLNKVGHKITTAKNGQEALALFKQQFYPIILTDWMMPNMNGLELCKAIRQMDNIGYVFMILLTAKDSKEDIISGFGAGADDFLAKPINPSELLARINSGIRILILEKSLRNANEEIRKLSVIDPLTGCYNRRYLSENLYQEIKRAKRYNLSLSIILCDIDHFKKVNDTHGHIAGDSVLEIFANRLKSFIRIHIDWVTRYGGEEFLIVLPETDIYGATIVAEKLRNIIHSQPMEVMNKKLLISASFGVTGFESINSKDNMTYESMISQADIYLYLAKKEGRNKVISGPLSVSKENNEENSSIHRARNS